MRPVAVTGPAAWGPRFSTTTVIVVVSPANAGNGACSSFTCRSAPVASARTAAGTSIAATIAFALGTVTSPSCAIRVRDSGLRRAKSILTRVGGRCLPLISARLGAVGNRLRDELLLHLAILGLERLAEVARL